MRFAPAMLLASMLSFHASAQAQARLERAPGTEAACKAFASTFCAQLARCWPVVLRINHGTTELCSEHEAIKCLMFMAPPGGSATPESIAKCGRDATVSCDAALHFGGCAPPGKLADGAACAVPQQCQSEHCARERDAQCGHCEPFTKKAKGEKCLDNTECQDGLLCSDWTCGVPVAGGAKCDRERACRQPLQCVSGKCRRRARQGEKCDEFLHREAAACESSLICARDSKTCQKIQIVESDGNCTASTAMCAGGLFCAGRFCNPNAKEGEACNQQEGPYCLFPARCIQGRCALPDFAACAR
jgi:hypothetical protein